MAAPPSSTDLVAQGATAWAAAEGLVSGEEARNCAHLYHCYRLMLVHRAFGVAVERENRAAKNVGEPGRASKAGQVFYEAMKVYECLPREILLKNWITVAGRGAAFAWLVEQACDAATQVPDNDDAFNAASECLEAAMKKNGWSNANQVGLAHKGATNPKSKSKSKSPKSKSPPKSKSKTGSEPRSVCLYPTANAATTAATTTTTTTSF